MGMICNLHAHTVRCNHASGTEREYLENALAGGLRIFGFADHAPYPFPGGYRSGFRMRTRPRSFLKNCGSARVWNVRTGLRFYPKTSCPRAAASGVFSARLSAWREPPPA